MAGGEPESVQAKDRSPVLVAGYLTQQKLEAALLQVVGEAWQGSERRVIEGRKLRWDMVFRSREGSVAVEYDGDEHYRNALKIKVDREKDELAHAAGVQVVRFPYWVQLTTTTMKHYFGIDCEIAQDFPHGFITTKIFPASYCELGVARFLEEFRSLPSEVRAAVALSLRDRAEEHRLEYVLPSGLRPLIE
jgi:hypothetical protein